MDNRKVLDGNDRIQELEAKLTAKISILDTNLEKHCIDFNAIINGLFASGSIKAGLVARKSGQILYISSNWSVEEEEVKKCIDGWQITWFRLCVVFIVSARETY
nr:hypothetical protein [Candidatus Sigynarchaeota archaeon]